MARGVVIAEAYAKSCHTFLLALVADCPLCMQADKNVKLSANCTYPTKLKFQATERPLLAEYKPERRRAG